MKKNPGLNELISEKERKQQEQYQKVLEPDKYGQPEKSAFGEIVKRYRNKIKIVFKS